MKKHSLFILSVLVAGVLLLPSCESPTSSETAPDAPGGITTKAGDEAILVSWNASEGAAAYDLYYTSDETSPSMSSTKVTSISGTSYLLDELSDADSNKSFIFALVAKSGSKTSDLSSPTSPIKPNPVFTVSFTNGTPNSAVLLLIIDVPYDPVTKEIAENSIEIVTTKSFTTDSVGVATLKAGFDRTKYLGFSLVYDTDGSKNLSPGDLVRGTGDGSYTYSYYSALQSVSFNNNFDATLHTWSVY